LVDLNGAIATWVVEVLQEIGDPLSLYGDVSDFQTHAAQLRTVQAAVSEGVASASWTGPAADTHADTWRQYTQVIDQAATNLEQAQQSLANHADNSWTIAREVVGLLLEIVEIFAAGLLLSWLFAGLSDVIWARAAPLMEDIVQLLNEYRAMMSNFADTMRSYGSVAGRIGDTVETLAVQYAPLYLRAYPGFYIAQAVPRLMSGQPFDWGAAAWQTAIFVGLDGSLNLVEDALEGTAVGGQVKDAIVDGIDNVAAKLGFGGADIAASDGAAAVTDEAAAADSVVPDGAATQPATPDSAAAESSAPINPTVDGVPDIATATAAPDAPLAILGPARIELPAPTLQPFHFNVEEEFNNVNRAFESAGGLGETAPTLAGDAAEQAAVDGRPSSAVPTAAPAVAEPALPSPAGEVASAPAVTPADTGVPAQSTIAAPESAASAADTSPVPGSAAADFPAEVPGQAIPPEGPPVTTQVTWAPFVPKSVGGSFYAGMVREAINTALGNGATGLIVAGITGEQVDPEQLGLSVGLGGVMAGVRQTLYGALPVGESFSYRGQPEDAPGAQRWFAEIPNQFSYYAMYLAARLGVTEAVIRQPVSTELSLGN